MQNFVFYILLLCASCLGSIAFISRLIPALKNHNLLDSPNQRSSHTVSTPSMGGITFIVASILALFIFRIDVNIKYGLSLIIVLGLLGLWDDLRDSSPKLRLLIELFISVGLTYLGYSFLPVFSMIGLENLPFWLEIILNAILMIGLMNAFNLIDGIDGLAGLVSLINMTTYTVLFFLIKDFEFALILCIGLGAVLGFLLFNFQPAKIFMGDSGSLLLGGLAILCSLQISKGGSTNYSIIALSTMILPAFDMIRLFIGRFLVNKSPMTADKNHYHHIMLLGFKQHKYSTLFISGCHLLFILLSIPVSNVLPPISALIVMLFIAIFIQGFGYIILLFNSAQKLKKLAKTEKKLLHIAPELKAFHHER